MTSRFFQMIFGRWFPEWFDRSLRDEANLSEKDKKFILSWSFGPLITFWYCIFRNCGHVILVTWLIEIIFAIIIVPIVLLLGGFSMVLFVWWFWLIVVLMLVFMILFNLFFMSIGRRMAWNRCNWNDMADFRSSETIWTILGILSLFLPSFRFRPR